MDEKIVKQMNYFKWYTRLPLIFAIATLVIFFIWGIVDPCVFQWGWKETYYGVMMLPNGFLCWLVWMAIGAVLGAIEYFVGKIMFSQPILTVLYLDKISVMAKK